MTDPAVTRFPGVHLRPDSNRYQFGLKPPDELAHHFPGEWAVRLSLRTSDLSKANAMAKVLHAEWAQKFEALAKSENPVAVDLTPVLATAIAAEIRRMVLAADDNMRDFPEVPNALLAIAERKRQPKSGSPHGSLLIDVAAPVAAPNGQGLAGRLAGLSEAQRGAVAAFNAIAEGQAAVDMAARNLKAVLALAASVAKQMGLSIDWTTDAGKAGLLECLKAHRTASADLIKRDAGAVIDTPDAPKPDARASAAPTAPTQCKRMVDAFGAWKGLGVRKEKTSRSFARHVVEFAEMMGDPELSTLSKSDGIRFRDALTRRAIKDINTAASADNVLTTIKAITNVAVEQGWLQVNPFAGLVVTHGGRKSAGREPWTSDDLTRLFDSPLFTEYLLPSGNSVATKAGADAAYWVPLICLYTGARPSEVCQLWTDDLSIVDGHLVVEFREDLIRGTSLKNPASWRALPIHSELVRLGLLDYWQSVAASSGGPGWLFPAVPKSGVNGAAGQFGQWFGVFKAAQGYGTPTKSLHSFRHTVETELGFAGLSATLVDAITGHEGQGTGRKVYGATIRRQASRLRPSIELLRYPGLCLPRVFKSAWCKVA